MASVEPQMESQQLRSNNRVTLLIPHAGKLFDRVLTEMKLEEIEMKMEQRQIEGAEAPSFTVIFQSKMEECEVTRRLRKALRVSPSILIPPFLKLFFYGYNYLELSWNPQQKLPE